MPAESSSTATKTAAAHQIQIAFRAHRLDRLAAAVSARFALQGTQRDDAATREALDRETERREKRSVGGVARRIRPIVREAACVALGSAALALLLPAPLTIPPPFAVDGAAAWHEQLRSALAGAGVLLGGFVAIFGSMLALYAKGWLRALWALHCAWVGGLLGVPFCLAIFRACEALGWPLDAVTLALLGWNHTAAGTLLTHWAPDDDERLRTWRRAYSAALSVALAWLLTALPWLTAVMAFVLLAVLDLVLVALPGAPVQKLDRLATRRRAAGERQPPGLTFKAEGLELGLGDFVIYGAVAAYSVALGSGALAAGLVGVLGGLALTMARLALARQRTVTPALPAAIVLATLLLAAAVLAWRPLGAALVGHGVVI